MQIEIITEPIPVSKLAAIAKNQFGDMVKAVVDIERKIMAIGGELHADEEAVLLDHGSGQEHLWGINLYPDKSGGDFVEFNSMINIRPSQMNNSRGVENPHLREKIMRIIKELVVN